MRSITARLSILALPCLLLSCLLLGSSAAEVPVAATLLSPSQDGAKETATGVSPLLEPGGSQAGTPALPGGYGDTYTPEELAAVDQALKAINCTRADLLFEKDYGKGYACFPAVRDMLRDPLAIAPFIETAPFIKQLDVLRPSGGGDVLALAKMLEFAAGLDSSSFSPPSDVPDLTQLIPGFVAQPRPTLDELARSIHSPEQLQAVLKEMLGSQLLATLGTGGGMDNWDELREVMPGALAWSKDIHSEFTDFAFWRTALHDPSFGPETVAAWHAKADADSKPLYDTLASTTLYLHPQNRYGWLLFVDPRDWVSQLPPEAWPQDAPLSVDTLQGRVTLGTPHDDHYSGAHEVLLDPGGNDTYTGCRIGSGIGLHDKSLGYFVDLDGDDSYDCGAIDFTLGSAVLGYGLFYDLGVGNDRYSAGSVSLGAAMGGLALFYDDGGSDSYSSKLYTQGAAAFGVGIMYDDSVQPAPNVPTDIETPEPIDVGALDNDTYTAWKEAQAFARTRGIAICANVRGNEVYQAGGVYLDAPLFTDRYHSFSQGFAIGERDIDYAGGIALLADYGGNDRYLGDIYNQGVGYWYSAGLLYDGGGNDTYEMTQYGQGSGIHLAVGGLLDESGHDTYVMHSGLGQGSSHDYATSILLDRAGNDKYYGTTTSCGASLTNSACLFIDGGGDDTYAARNEGGLNYGRPARDAGSIGVFVDMAGKDDYLGKMLDSSSWTSTQYGTGVDVDPVAATLLSPELDGGKGAAATAKQAAPAQSAGGLAVPTDRTVIPEIVGYQGPLTQAVFDELWEIAIRWEVGDNQLIVPKARARLIAFGPDVLPYVEAEMDDPNSLAVRGYVDVLKAFAWLPAAPAEPAPAPGGDAQKAAGVQQAAPPQPAQTLPLVEALLGRQLASGSEPRQVAALSVAGELALSGAGGGVAALLDSPDIGMQRRALGTLGLLGSHAGDARVLALLDPATDERLLKVAIVTACKLQLDCYPQLRALLDVPKFTARDTLLGQLAAQSATYGDALRADFIEPGGLSTTAQRMLLRLQLALKQKPDAQLVDALYQYLGSDDWGVRADAVELVRQWTPLCYGDPALDPLFTGNTGLQREISNMRESIEQPWPVRN